MTLNFRSILNIVAITMIAICYSCSSDEPETENWNWNWNWNWDEEYEMGFLGVLASFEQLTPRNVVWHGELLPFEEATKAMLRVAACEDAQATMTIKTNSPGEVKKCIGTKAFEIDKLIVEGPMNKDDCTYIKRCIAAGNLHSLDLSRAQFPDNTVPENSFILYEYPDHTMLWPAYLPLFHITLPDDVEVGRYAFMNSLITELDLMRIKSLDDFCFKRNVWLSKTLDVPSNIEHIGYGVFEDAGDGEIIVNFGWRKIPPFTFRLANVKKLNISDNVEAIERDGLIGIHGLESLILPSSVKTITTGAISYCKDLKHITLPESIEEIECESLTNLPNLKTMTVLFNNPGVAFDPYSAGDISYDAQKRWAFGTYVDRNNETATPRNVRISVPATALIDFKASAAWSWFNNNSFVAD